jgi:NTE family protein
MTTGLVLTGGGARGAYQVGALRAIADLAETSRPFDIVTGVSAGAINAAAVAVAADDFGAGMVGLESTWRSLRPDSVYRTDLASLGEIAAGWLRRLGGAGCLGADDVNALLDTSPLRALLRRTLPMARIRDHVQHGLLRGAALTATSYHRGIAITSYDAPGVAPWERAGRIGRPDRLTVDHVLASAAIPLLFPPVTIGGVAFGDGCIRLTAPLSPAIHLGARRIVAIGIRARDDAAGAADDDDDDVPSPGPSPAEIGGVLLDAVFLDSLDADAERLQRINATLASMNPRQRRMQALRPIPLLVLQPSVDLGRLAVERYGELPAALRYLLRGVGADGRRGWDLVSYLAFEPVYIQRLLELGYHDTWTRRAEVASFLAAPAAPIAA